MSIMYSILLNSVSVLFQAFLSDALLWDTWCRREHAGDCGFQPHDHRRAQPGPDSALPHWWDTFRARKQTKLQNRNKPQISHTNDK